MCDGTVRFQNESIDGRVWARMVTPNGGRLGIGPSVNGRPSLLYEDGSPRGNAGPSTARPVKRQNGLGPLAKPNRRPVCTADGPFVLGAFLGVR